MNKEFNNERGQSEIKSKAKKLAESLEPREIKIYYLIGRQYENGEDGRLQNLSRALEYYLKAAAAGHPEAQYRLAICYQEGIGVEKNSNEALKWLKKG